MSLSTPTYGALALVGVATGDTYFKTDISELWIYNGGNWVKVIELQKPKKTLRMIRLQ